VIRILEILCASAAPVSLADLARALATPKSSLAALLRGLAEEGFVVAADGAWRLGPGAYGLGSALLEARRRLSTPDLLREGMRRLATASGETVLFAVPDADLLALTYVDVIESRNAVRFAVAVGDRRPLYATAGGRMLLAARSEDEVRAYLAQLKPERLTATAETDKAQTVDQAADGVTGTAALIHDAGGRASGALVVAAPSARSQDRLAELRRLVREEAGVISRSLGWREHG
jgi:DNA-binding IclR family transcriptional regulator